MKSTRRVVLAVFTYMLLSSSAPLAAAGSAEDDKQAILALVSRFQLDRPDNPLDGISTRLLRKRGGKWDIPLNHVSSSEIPCVPGTR